LKQSTALERMGREPKHTLVQKCFKQYSQSALSSIISSRFT